MSDDELSEALMLGFGMLYGRLRDLEEISAAIAWMGPPVVAIVIVVGARLARPLRRPWQIGVALLSMAAIELGVGVFEVVMLGVGFALALELRRAPARPPVLALAILALLLLPKLRRRPRGRPGRDRGHLRAAVLHQRRRGALARRVPQLALGRRGAA